MQQAQQKPLPIYLRYPRWVAYTGLALFAFVTGLVNVASNIALLHHLHSAYLPWEPYVWEYSSAIVVVVVVPLIVAFDRRLPIGWNTWRINILRHAIATVVFSAYFSAGSIALRKLAYAAFGSHYDINMVPNCSGARAGYVLLPRCTQQL